MSLAHSHDEMVTGQFQTAEIEKLIHPPHPHIFHFYSFFFSLNNNNNNNDDNKFNKFLFGTCMKKNILYRQFEFI